MFTLKNCEGLSLFHSQFNSIRYFPGTGLSQNKGSAARNPVPAHLSYSVSHPGFWDNS